MKETHNSLDKNHIQPQTMGDPISFECAKYGISKMSFEDHDLEFFSIISSIFSI